MSGSTPNHFMIELFMLTCATYDNIVSEGLYDIYL